MSEDPDQPHVLMFFLGDSSRKLKAELYSCVGKAPGPSTFFPSSTSAPPRNKSLGRGGAWQSEILCVLSQAFCRAAIGKGNKYLLTNILTGLFVFHIFLHQEDCNCGKPKAEIRPGKGQKTGLELKRQAEELRRSHGWWERTVGGS